MIMQAADTKQLYDVVGLDRCHKYLGDSHLTHYAYNIQNEILTQLKSRTAYIASHRKDENGSTKLDADSYTGDEFDLDRPLTRDAMANVFVCLVEYARGIGDAYLYDEGYTTHQHSENHGYISSTSYTYDSSNHHISVTLKCDKAISNTEYAIISTAINYKVKDILGDVYDKPLLVSTRINADTVHTEENGKFVYTVQVSPEYDVDLSDNGLGSEEIQNVMITTCKERFYYVTPTVVKKGDWLEVTNLDGSVYLYVCHTDCTTNNKFGCPNYYQFTSVDFRGCIHYVLYFSNMNNKAALEAIDTHIENAIISYCMYRWFLLSDPTESQIWWAEYLRRIELIKELLSYGNTNIKNRPFFYL